MTARAESAGAQLVRLIEDGTGALAELDVESLELLQERALQVKWSLERGQAVDASLLKILQSHRRVFAEVLRTTGEHVNLLRRMSGRMHVRTGNGRTGNGGNPWDR
jgi:hypothetical protein